ncbi:CMRF35-like molecule 3 isoform X2 [Hemibagrus wyckioides]|uniref:CMRF35-like molecule 3 isoform X2 n=1 Tax=Hemibagrus wyckioides TaxID=337641 RepID=UPI00266D75B4|nr:CMRF35-like molecule 3 isoform X2 [Hemibagrus wyckioides]
MKILLNFTFYLIIAGTDAVTTVTGYRGRSVQIKCPYESGYEKNIKYLCRGKCSYLWTKDIPVQSGSPPKDTRFSLYDNTTARVFIITITDLRTEDGGTYWCTIQQTVTDIYTKLLLLVKTDDPTVSTVSQSMHTTHSASTYIMSPVHVEAPLKTTGSETLTQSSRETNKEPENDQNLLPVQARENSSLPETVYMSLDPTTSRSDSVYQSLSISNNHSDSVYQSLSITSNQRDSIYQSLSFPKTN